MRFPLLALILTPAAIAAATVAQAAEPSEGKVSASSPTVSWKGQVLNSGVSQNAWNQDPEAPCEAPACDSFKLEVADSANLLLKLKGFAENTAGGNPTCSIRVTSPDGKFAHNTGPCGPETELKVTIKNAAKGAYVIDVANSHVVTRGPEAYEASATLAVPPPAAAPAPAPGATPAPGTAPAPAAQPAPATLTAKVPALSAKKLKKAKKFTVKLSSSAPLTGVNGILVNKKKQVGAGRLASMGGTAKLVVKLKKALKKGTYQLGIGGRDAQGRNVIVSVKVKIKK